MDLSVMIAAGVTLFGAIVMVWALVERRRIVVPAGVPGVMVLPALDTSGLPPTGFAKGSVEFALVDGEAIEAMERPRTLRPSHARRA